MRDSTANYADYPRGRPAAKGRLADAAIESYQRAKRNCGQFHPENNQECIYPTYQRACIHCPMEWIAEIEEALKDLGEEGSV